MDDEQLLDLLSEMLLGHRQGSNAEILQAVVAIKVKAMNHEQNLQVERLFNCIDDLSDLANSIKADA